MIAVPDSLSLLLGSLEYDSNSTDILDSIPEREWRLLAALARKREEDDEREKLADQFRRMWQKEKEERELVSCSIYLLPICGIVGHNFLFNETPSSGTFKAIDDIT